MKTLVLGARTLTPGAWFLLFMAAVALLLGLPLGWVELVAPGIASLALVLMALLFLIGKKTLRAELTIETERVVVGTDVKARLVVTNAGRKTRVLTRIDLPIENLDFVGEGVSFLTEREALSVEIPALRAGQNVSNDLAIPTACRGLIGVGPLRLTRSSPLGIVASTQTWGTRQKVYVHPKTVSLSRTQTGRVRDLEGITRGSLVSDDLAFHTLREYSAGDSPRHVHWKATAKTGTLMVRQYEETVKSSTMVILDTDRGAYLDEEEAELAVSAAASLALNSLDNGRSVSMMIGPQAQGVERWKQVRTSYPGASSVAISSRQGLLDNMSTLRFFEDGANLAQVCSAAAHEPTPVSVVVLVSGSETSLADFRRAALNFHVEVGILLVCCSVASPPRLRYLNGATVATIAVLEDLRDVLVRQMKT